MGLTEIGWQYHSIFTVGWIASWKPISSIMVISRISILIITIYVRSANVSIFARCSFQFVDRRKRGQNESLRLPYGINFFLQFSECISPTIPTRSNCIRYALNVIQVYEIHSLLSQFRIENCWFALWCSDLRSTITIIGITKLNN